MGRTITIFLIGLFGAWAVIYLAFAFGSWSFNPGTWGGATRGLVAYLWLFVGPLAGVGLVQVAADRRRLP